MKKNATVLIVEDELITAASIADLLEEEDYVVIGTAKDAAKAMLLCNQASEPPSVILCDINIKGNLQGVDLAGQLKQLYNCEIIFLTAYTDTKTLKNAFSKDPVMYVVKPYSDAQILVALQMAFHKIFTRAKVIDQSKLDLTDREIEIARLVAQGLSSKQIARNLSISIETVKTHRSRMLKKNQISNFPHLVYLLNSAL